MLESYQAKFEKLQSKLGTSPKSSNVSPPGILAKTVDNKTDTKYFTIGKRKSVEEEGKKNKGKIQEKEEEIDLLSSDNDFADTNNKKTKNKLQEESVEEYSVVEITEEIPSSPNDIVSIPSIATNEGNNNNNKTFKYVEVIRKKADRELLPGYECEQCRMFYDAINEGSNVPFDRKKFINDCSRHKHLFEPPSTPPDFWEVSFPENETQES